MVAFTEGSALKIFWAWIGKLSLSGFLLVKWCHKVTDCPSLTVLNHPGVGAACGDFSPWGGGFPWLDKPDWLGSSQMLEEILGTKGTTKHCLQGLPEHDCPHPNLL